MVDHSPQTLASAEEATMFVFVISVAMAKPSAILRICLSAVCPWLRTGPAPGSQKSFKVDVPGEGAQGDDTTQEQEDLVQPEKKEGEGRKVNKLGERLCNLSVSLFLFPSFSIFCFSSRSRSVS